MTLFENLFAEWPADLPDEQVVALLRRPGVRLERIISKGQATGPGQWLRQDQEEWVLVLAGAARLTLQGESTVALGIGDHILIPAGRLHRVDWTDPDTATIWLALHIG